MATKSVVLAAMVVKNGFTTPRKSYTGPEPMRFMKAIGSRHMEPTIMNGVAPIMPSLMA